MGRCAGGAPEREGIINAEITDGPPPGIVAYVDGEAAGWIRIGPRTKQAHLAHTRAIAAATSEPFDDETVWAVTCFSVRREHRGQGLNKALLTAAIDYARRSGARLIEGYSIDTSKTSSNELFHGTLSPFVAAGFTRTRELHPGRPDEDQPRPGADRALRMSIESTQVTPSHRNHRAYDGGMQRRTRLFPGTVWPFVPYVLVSIVHVVALALESPLATDEDAAHAVARRARRSGVVAWGRIGPRPAVALLLTALFFSWLGDEAGAFSRSRRSCRLCSFFGVTHLAYIALFLQTLRLRRLPLWTVVYALW